MLRILKVVFEGGFRICRNTEIRGDEMNNKKVTIKDDCGRDCVIENIQSFHKHLQMFHKKGVSIHDENGHYFTVDDSFREKINGLLRERS